MNSIDSYREKTFASIYYSEHSRKEKLSSNSTFHAGILLALTSILIFFFNYLLEISSKPVFITFCLLITIYAVMVGVAVYFFIRSIYKYEYCFIPDATKLNRYLNDLKSFHNKDAEHIALQDFRLYIIDKYIEASDINSANNDRKSHCRHKSNTFIIIALIILALNSVFYGIDKIHTHTSLVTECIMPKDKSMDRPTSADKPVVPPTPPPNKMIVEGAKIRAKTNILRDSSKSGKKK